MAKRPDAVRIGDLAEPVFSEDVVEMMSAVAPMAAAIPWTLDAALEQARAGTGLDDFGEDIYSEPFSVFIECADKEGGLSPMGEVTIWGQIVQFLQSRLLVEDQIGRHPQILQQPIKRPIIIAGLPRTGTTHLHNLISADPGLRYLPWWESLEPVPPPGEPGDSTALDPRLQRAADGIEMRDRVMPHFKRMHDMWPDHAHEEIHLLAIAGSTMFFEALVLSPTWRDWYLDHDQTPWYAYMKRILQVLQHLRGGERWILKSPQHLEQFGPLRKTFPDATFVITHRDPVSITASMATMVAYAARLSRDPVDPVAIGRFWSDRIERMLCACMDDRDMLPADQSIDVLFHEFMRDDIAMVERIYVLAAQPFNAEVRAAMDAFMQEHPRGKHGRVLYDLAEFGLDRAERREALRAYVDRFGVALEGE
ncbi:MAG: sulfotransferase [Deltaproteobacteria bacterium]|nr:sulfotransferase [Deltaproteobacteria bacterium]MBW2697501.1 sulfotransferase [Deltaproteobacteria bacterium]